MKPCILYKKEKQGKVRCLACSHKCLISENDTGICGVRKNIKGRLYLLVYGKVAAMHVDPIEKKPLYHFLPGTNAFSVGTAGCNFKCLWCQNADISQIKPGIIFGKDITPEEIVREALKTGCKSIAYTYNEPAIFAEFVKDTAEIARKNGLKNILVTNGYFSKESFDFLSDFVDAMNIDLKSFSNATYKKYCRALFKPVLNSIKWAHEKGIHTEITTLVIPGLNDSDKELEKIAKFISSIDKNIVWHISRFFPMHKMTKKPATSIKTLRRAEAIGKKYLNYVYLGNV